MWKITSSVFWSFLMIFGFLMVFEAFWSFSKHFEAFSWFFRLFAIFFVGILYDFLHKVAKNRPFSHFLLLFKALSFIYLLLIIVYWFLLYWLYTHIISYVFNMICHDDPITIWYVLHSWLYLIVICLRRPPLLIGVIIELGRLLSQRPWCPFAMYTPILRSKAHTRIYNLDSGIFVIILGENN